MKLDLTISRTVLAFALTLLAVVLPCGKWFIYGSHGARTAAQQVQEETRWVAESFAIRFAERLSSRLETLRETESHRPYYHYQSLYHDPKGAYEGASVIPSPLSQELGNPLVHAHFQIDAAGRLTLPTLNDELPEMMSPEQTAAQRLIQQELQAAAPICLARLRELPALAASLTAEPSKTEVMDAAAYEQNQSASRLYREIKSGRAGLRERLATKPSAGNNDEVRILVGPFRWHTITVNQTNALVALREVQTPNSKLVQGFMIEPLAIAELLKSASLPIRFLPGAPAPNDSTEVLVRIAPAVWRVSVDASRSLEDAQARAKAIRESFNESYLTGVIGALTAGLCVVVLVWQSERLARQRSQFAASAAHELRTPLTGLRMYSEMLAEGLGDPGRARNYARRLAGEVERLSRVVTNMLGFSRLERGTLKVRPELGDLAAAVRDCVSQQQLALEAAGAHVELSIPAELPPVRFDRDAVTEILQNLLDNAEKYSRSSANRMISVSLNREPDAVMIVVSDHGSGILPAVQRRLFRPFERGTDPDAPPGLGLGLTLVAALVRAQHARIRYSDAPGGGACFSVRFPLE